MSTYFIGFKGNTACGSEETKKQIDKVKSLECRLQDPDTPDKKLSWVDFDNQKEPRTLFQSIIKDRVMRIDKKTPMCDRPSFAVVTALHDKAVRLEYYEGHDGLKLVYDVRTRELIGKELPIFLESDPFKYDPIEYLSTNFPALVDSIGGASETKKILKEMHKPDKPAKCRDCRAFRQYDQNGKKRYRCVVHKRAILLKNPDTIPLWCPIHMDPEIQKLIYEQNKHRKQ